MKKNKTSYMRTQRQHRWDARIICWWENSGKQKNAGLVGCSDIHNFMFMFNLALVIELWIFLFPLDHQNESVAHQ